MVILILDVEGNQVREGDYIEDINNYDISKIIKNDGYNGQFIVINPITKEEKRIPYDIECRVLPAKIAMKLLIKHKLS